MAFNLVRRHSTWERPANELTRSRYFGTFELAANVWRIRAHAPARKAGGSLPRADVPSRRVSRPALLAYAGKQFVELLQLLRQCGRRAL